MKRCLSIAAVTAVLGSPAFGGGGEVGSAAEGAELAGRLCAGCHAVAAGRTSPHPAAPPFTTLAARWPAANLAEALAEGIVVGHDEGVRMPEFALPSAQIEDLIAYLDALTAR